jgi:hypothetical protein
LSSGIGHHLLRRPPHQLCLDSGHVEQQPSACAQARHPLRTRFGS